MPNEALDQAQSGVSRLLEQCASVQLATLNSEGEPEISYTPYIRHEGHFFLYISRLARHTGNLLVNPLVSLLLIQDESHAKNIFARQRISLQGKAEVIAAHETQHNAVLDLFEQHHGNTVALLRTLPDFLLFRIQVSRGSFVQGFGQAFELDAMTLDPTTQITGK